MAPSNDVSDRIEQVSNATAGGPQLVTLAVAPDSSIEAARERIEEAHAESEYVGDDETSEPATEALERTRRVVDEYDELPENGLVVYAGVIDGETVDYVFDDLASPVSATTFQRANEFDTGPLGVESEAATYGLLVVEHGAAALGTLEGEDVERIATLDGDWREDNPTGGALGDREQVDREFFEQVAERAAREFLGEAADELRKDDAEPAEQAIDPVEGLFVGGSTVTAAEFLEEDYLDHRLRNRLVTDDFEVGDVSGEGLDQLASKARDHLDVAEREAVADRLAELDAELEDGDEAVAGEDATVEALTLEAVSTTLAAERLPAEKRRVLAAETQSQGGDFVVVPEEVDDADRLQEDADVGALLRFPID